MENIKYLYENEILSLTDKDKVMGEVYLITNKKNGMKYVGQTVSHRKNKGKYRPFGSYGRFNDHISEAINNTKKKQCTYLNNAIRKYGQEQFEYVLIQRCNINELDTLETLWIKNHDSLYPKGYNLTPGGKTHAVVDTGPKILNNTKKRGREYGYKHKESTIEKMKDRVKTNPKAAEIKVKKSETMSNAIREYSDKCKIDALSKLDLKDDIEQYIKPIYNKNTGLIHNYKIKIGNSVFKTNSNKDTLNDKYNRLKNILEKAKEKRQQSKVKNVRIAEKQMDNPQPLI